MVLVEPESTLTALHPEWDSSPLQRINTTHLHPHFYRSGYGGPGGNTHWTLEEEQV